MGITEQPTAASADQADQSVHDVILEMLEQNPALDAAVKDAVLDALAEVVGQAQDNRETPTARNLSHEYLGDRVPWHRSPSPAALVRAAAVTITPEETPRLANAAERNVYQTLLEQLQPNDRVVPGQRVTDHLKDHEVDFVVAIEGAGIVCLEVKGGDVWHDGDTWWQRRRGHEHRIDPVRQAREACYALREFIEKDDRWTQGRLRWDHVIVLPNAEIPDDFALPECPRWKVIDRNNLPTLVDKLKHVLVQQELDRPLLTLQGIEQLSTALSGRGLPQRSVVARALANQDAADALTEHQAVILDAIQLLNRVEIRGGGGQRQDLSRGGTGPSAFREGPARGPALLLPWPGLLPGAHHRQLAAPPPTGLRR